MTPISICTIIKNEQKHISNFLDAIIKHLGSYPYEVILVDTGSTDDTLALAGKYIGKCFTQIYHFEWCGDFSKARNYALSLAKYPYILTLDCDEYISSFDVTSIDKFVKQCPDSLGVISINNHITVDKDNNKIGDSIVHDNVTRFFKKSNFHYEGIIHEQLTPYDVPRVALPITIEHYGYQGTPEEIKAKAMRNNALLFDMLKETPDDPYLYYQIGKSFSAIKDYESTYEYLGKALEFDVDPRLRYVREIVIEYGYAMLETGKIKDALDYEGIYEEFKCLSDFLTLMGLIYLRNGMVLEAYEMFEQATNAPEYLDEATKTTIPLQNMQVIHDVLKI